MFELWNLRFIRSLLHLMSEIFSRVFFSLTNRSPVLIQKNNICCQSGVCNGCYAFDALSGSVAAVRTSLLSQILSGHYQNGNHPD